MPNVEMRKFTLNDIVMQPECFNNKTDGYGVLTLVDVYGMLFPNGANEKPIWWIRHCNVDKVRFAGFFEPNDSLLGLQNQKHMLDIAQKTAHIGKYRQIDEESMGFDCSDPFFEYRFYEDHFTLKETNVLDIVAKPFDKAIFKHADNTMVTSQITIPCVFEGFYEGKPVTGMGNFELVYFPKDEKRNLNDFLTYIYTYGLGVKPNGMKELFMVSGNVEGNNHGLYWSEEDGLVLTEHCQIETEWILLPYMNDGTCIFKDAVFHIGDKIINYKPKWGNKGITPWPRVELGGQSQSNGTWYEGNTEYEHQLYFTFIENMGVYDYRLEQAGYAVCKE